jgi:hypothetical protein
LPTESKNIARGQIKVNSSDTERGEAGLSLMKNTAPKAAPKNNLAMAGGAIIGDDKNPNKNSLLKKKTDVSATQ